MSGVSYEKALEIAGQIVFTVKGISMRPLFHADTDAIVVRKCKPDELKNLDIVLHTRPSPQGKQYVLHRIVGRKPNGDFIIAGDNCVTYDIVPPADILGITVSAQRRNTPIKLSGTKYELYTRLWCKPYKMRFVVLGCRNIAKRIVGKTLRLLHLR